MCPRFGPPQGLETGQKVPGLRSRSTDLRPRAREAFQQRAVAEAGCPLTDVESTAKSNRETFLHDTGEFYKEKAVTPNDSKARYTEVQDWGQAVTQMARRVSSCVESRGRQSPLSVSSDVDVDRGETSPQRTEAFTDFNVFNVY